jgi:hypothetical protein
MLVLFLEIVTYLFSNVIKFKNFGLVSLKKNRNPSHFNIYFKYKIALKYCILIYTTKVAYYEKKNLQQRIINIQYIYKY